ncbi:MAG: hypothetical protein HY235_08610 [Acidobacteria bacterium]|nr:hypothetical protein [Acidobacteriota bacterium]
MKNSLLAICLAVGSILPIHAQQGSLTKLKGSYVLSEEGVSQAGSLVTLAALTFAENGSVSGVQLIQTANGTARLDVQGVYNFDTAKVGTLTLNSSTTDAEGNAVNSAANYKILLEPDNELRALRMNLGVYATARLVPAATS